MSNALAIAGVSAMLRHLLEGVVDDRFLTAMADVKVTAGPPDRVPVSEDEAASRLNLFLYQVTPNGGWRNMGMPSRDSDGRPVSNPPLALDLHYLLTAYGAQELDAEVLLGFGMQVLHEVPVLTREELRTALAPPVPPPPPPAPPSVIPRRFASFPPIDLADQVEQLKITPYALNGEEMSRLWSSLQARYRPTVAYRVSVVLIESRRPVGVPLPVRRPTVTAVPAGQPYIEEVRAAGGVDQPIVAGTTLVIRGRDLRSPGTRLRLADALVAPTTMSDAEVTLPLTEPPVPPTTLRAGVLGIQVVQPLTLGDPPLEHRGFESNVAPFVLRPTITASAAELVPPVTGAADVTLTFSPPVRAGQRAVLLLNQHVPAAAAAYQFEAERADVHRGSIVFRVTGVDAGTYLARTQVDGAHSLVRLDAAVAGDIPEVRIP